MAARNRIVPNHILQIRDAHSLHLAPHAQIVHIVDEPPPLRHHSIISLEDRLAAQHRDINILLADNQHLAATHVALRQELDASLDELRIVSDAAGKERMEQEAEVRGAMERSLKAEAEARVGEEMRVELGRVRADLERFGRVRSELVERMKGMRLELERAREEVGEVADVRGEIEVMSREIQRGRFVQAYLGYTFVVMWT